MLYWNKFIFNETKMTTPEMLDYIKRQQQAGKTSEQIAQALRQSGWQEADIQLGLGTAPAGPAGEAALPPATEILKTAWKIYQEKFWLLLGITAVPGVIMLAFGLLFGGGMLLTRTGHGGFFTSVGTGAILLLIMLVVLVYFGVWSSVAQIFVIKDHQENLTFQEAFKRAQPHLGTFFTTSLLAGLAIAGGMILFIIPGILFALWFSQAMFVVICENLYNTAALKKSKTYVQGRLWEVFKKYLLIGVIVYGIAIITSFIPLLSNLISFVLTPLTLVYGYVLYRGLRGEKV